MFLFCFVISYIYMCVCVRGGGGGEERVHMHTHTHTPPSPRIFCHSITFALSAASKRVPQNTFPICLGRKGSEELRLMSRPRTYEGCSHQTTVSMQLPLSLFTWLRKKSVHVTECPVFCASYR